MKRALAIFVSLQVAALVFLLCVVVGPLFGGPLTFFVFVVVGVALGVGAAVKTHAAVYRRWCSTQPSPRSITKAWLVGIMGLLGMTMAATAISTSIPRCDNLSRLVAEMEAEVAAGQVGGPQQNNDVIQHRSVDLRFAREALAECEAWP